MMRYVLQLLLAVGCLSFGQNVRKCLNSVPDDCEDCVYNKSTSNFVASDFDDGGLCIALRSNLTRNVIDNHLVYTWMYNSSQFQGEISVTLYEVNALLNESAVAVHGCCGIPLSQKLCRTGLPSTNNVFLGVNYMGIRIIDPRRILFVTDTGSSTAAENNRFIEICPPGNAVLFQNYHCPCVSLDTHTGLLRQGNRSSGSIAKFRKANPIGVVNDPQETTCLFSKSKGYLTKHAVRFKSPFNKAALAFNLSGYYWSEGRLFDVQNQPIQCSELNSNFDFACFAAFKNVQPAEVLCIDKLSCFVQVDVVDHTVQSQVYQLAGDMVSGPVIFAIAVAIGSGLFLLILVTAVCRYRRKAKGFFRDTKTLPSNLADLLNAPPHENKPKCSRTETEHIDMFLPGGTYVIETDHDKVKSVSVGGNSSRQPDRLTTHEKMLCVRASDKRIQRPDEYSDSEDEGEGGRKNEESHKKKKRKYMEGDATVQESKAPASGTPAQNGVTKQEDATSDSSAPVKTAENGENPVTGDANSKDAVVPETATEEKANSEARSDPPPDATEEKEAASSVEAKATEPDPAPVEEQQPADEKMEI